MNPAERSSFLEGNSLYLACEEVYEMQNDRRLFHGELPAETILSFPLPTMRWNQPMFASFASTITDRSQKTVVQSGPIIWWLIDARDGRLCLFTRYHIYPFASVHWDTVNMQPTPSDELDFLDIFRDMRHLNPLFFAGQPGEPIWRKSLQTTLELYVIHPLLLPQYHALAPDFFAWLKQDI
jgi:hypothetical protein